MGDLISRKALIEELRKEREAVYSHVFCHTDCQHEEELALDLEQFIENAPTVEAIPVKAICDALLENIKIVHCKDCSHWGTGLIAETEHVKCCEFAKWMVGENGYCVYGELRTSAK